MSAQDTQETKPWSSLDEYRLLGNSGLRVSPLCLGTMTFGNAWRFGDGIEDCKQVFDKYYELGGNFIDTANVYSNGQSEEFLGALINERRSDLIVATKYTANPSAGAAIAGQFGGRYNPNMGGNHRKSLVENLDMSLKRMKMGSIDLFYVHLWEYRTPVDEVMRALDDVVRSGKVHYVAISDTPAWMVTRANTMAELRGWSRFIGLQTRYNLLERSMEAELEPAAAEVGLGIVPWGCLAEGFLTGKHTRESIHANTGRSMEIQRHASDEKNWKILDALKSVTPAGNPLSASAIQWTIRKASVTSALVGARNVTQLEDNIKALSFQLSDEQMNLLDQVSAPSSWPFPASVAGHVFAWTGEKNKLIPPKFAQFWSLPVAK